MTINVETVGSPGWWLKRLARKLEDRQPRLTMLHRYFDGDPPLPHGIESTAAITARDRAWRAFQRKARTNFAELSVEKPRQRMNLTGFRTAAAGDETGDAEARAMFEANGGAVLAADVHAGFLSLGDSYVIVGGPKAYLGGAPLITAEDARQVVTIHDPEDQRRARAAAKFFHDDELDRDIAYLYLPGDGDGLATVRVAYRDRRATARRSQAVRFSPAAWSWDPERGGDGGETLPHQRVPVVGFRNRRGVAEFEPHTDVLDRINHQILQRMVIATMQAYRQRAVKGDLPETDENGETIDYDALFVSDPGAVWQLPGGVELWESESTDLTPILQAVKDDVAHFAAVTELPLHVFSPDAANQSAEGASLQREGLVFKCEDRIARASEGWKDVISLMFLSLEQPDTERADRSKIEVLWQSPERTSLAERADAESKAGAIPFRSRMKHIWHFTEPQIADMEQERLQDAFVASIAAPPTAAAAAPTAAEQQQLPLEQ
jgi:hypothetical protein